MNKEGSLSINSENIFPIIKKWLYSDHDIFFRELVSNGCDAVTKLKKLDMIGEYTIPEGKELCVKVTADAETKTITFTDNGIGMDANEIDQYINQIAFSGARDFLDKYKDKTNDDQIIGHFGLGFYSAFMVADRVTIDSLSYKEGAKAVHWESDEGTSFEMTDSAKTEIGTTITLYLNEDSYEFCNEYRAKEILDKYCSFMPIPIYFEAIKTAEEQARIDEAEKKAKEEEEKRKAEEAAKMAIQSPLLESSINGAHGVILSVIGSEDIELDEIEQAASMIQAAAHPDAHIIFGAFIDENMDDEIRVVVIATGFDNVPNSAKMSMDGNKDKDSGSTGLFTEAATAAADKKPARASASKPSSDVGSDDAAFDVLMRIFDKDNR